MGQGVRLSKMGYREASQVVTVMTAWTQAEAEGTDKKGMLEGENKVFS